MEKKDWFKWAVGILGSVTVALIFWIGSQLMFGFEKRVEDIAVKAMKNGGVSQEKLVEVDNKLTALDVKLQGQAENLEVIRDDLRNIVRILRE